MQLASQAMRLWSCYLTTPVFQIQSWLPVLSAKGLHIGFFCILMFAPTSQRHACRYCKLPVLLRCAVEFEGGGEDDDEKVGKTKLRWHKINVNGCQYILSGPKGWALCGLITILVKFLSTDWNSSPITGSTQQFWILYSILKQQFIIESGKYFNLISVTILYI